MSKTVEVSFVIGAALAGGFKTAFSSAGKLMSDLGNRSSELSKAAGQVGDYQKLQQSIKTNQAAMLAMRNQAGQLGQQMKDTAAQTAALKTQFNAAQAEASKMGAAHQRSKESYQAVSAQVKELREQMKAVPSEELRQKLRATEAEAQKLRGTVAQDSAQFKAASTRAKELERQLKGSADQEKAMSRESANLSSKADTLQGKLDRDREALSNLRSSLTGAGVDMKNLASEQARLTAQSDQFAAAQKRIQDAKAAYEATKQQLSWSNIKGDVLTSAGLAMTMKAPVTTAMDFESAMSGVNAVMFSGAKTDEEKAANAAALEELRNQALSLGSTTQFTAMQAAQSQENLARAGFDKDQILAAMPGLLNMAAAEGMDLANAASIAADTLRGFNMEAGESGFVADVLAKTSAMSNTNISELGDAMKYVAPLASDLGVSIGQTSALMAAMANNGIKGSQAGTALRSVFTRLSKEPKAVAKALSALGIASRDSKGNMRTLPSLLEEISQKTKGMGTAQKEGLLANIFGTEAVSAMAAVMKAVEKGDIANFEEALKRENVTGTSKEMAGLRNDNLRGDLTALSSAWEGLNVVIGDVFLPHIRSAVKHLTGFISTVTSLATKFPTVTKVIVGTFGGLAAAKIGRTIFGISRNLIKLPFLMAKLTGATVAAGQATGKFSLAQKAWNGVAKVGAAAGRGLSEGWAAAGRGLSKVWDAAKPALYSAKTKALTVAQDAWNMATKAGAKIGRGMMKAWDIGKLIALKVQTIAITAATNAWKAAQWLWNAAMNANPIGLIVIGIAGLIAAGYALYKNWDTVKAGLLAAWDWVWDKVKNFWNWLKSFFSWDSVAEAWETAKAKVVNSWETFKGLFTFDWLQNPWNSLVSWWDSAKAAVSQGWEDLKASFLPGWLSDPWSSLVSGWNSAKGIIETGWGAVKNSFIGEWASNVWDTLTSGWDTAKDTLSKGWSLLTGDLKIDEATASAIWNGVSTFAEAAWGNITKTWETARGLIETGWNALKDSFLGDWASGVWDSLTSGASAAWDTIKSGWNTVTDWIGSGLDTVWNGAVSAWDWVWGNDPSARQQGNDQQILAAQVKDVTMLNKMYEGFRERVSEMSAAWEPFKASLGEGFENIYGVMQTLGSHIQTVVIPAVNNLATALNGVASNVNAIAQAGGLQISTARQYGARFGSPAPVHHAMGGIFSTPHLGLVADDGPEAILPLSNPSRGIPLWMAAGEAMGMSFGGGASVNNSYTGGSPTINIAVNGNADQGALQRIRQIVEDVLRNQRSYEERVAFV